MVEKSFRLLLKKQRTRRNQLRVENLEDRRLLAVDVAALASTEARFLVTYNNQESAVVRQSDASAAAIESTLQALRSDPSVRFAEVDYRVQTALAPNDTRYAETWGLHSSSDIDVDAPEAWDKTTGSMKTAVAVIDTGVDYTHPDLYQNIWLNQGEIPTAVKNALIDADNDGLITFRDLNDTRNQGAGKITDLNGNGRIDAGDLLKPLNADGTGGWADGQSNDGDKYVDDLVGWNFVSNTNDPYDDNGHGTHVAGTIGAHGNNNVGVPGLMWSVQVVGLKFMDAAGGGYVSSAVAALNYAVSKSIPISNNSWGGGGYSQAMYDALNNARAKGHLFIAAAGNGGADGVGDNNDSVANYPSNYNLDNVIAVAATDKYDALAKFSNYGSTTVDVAAPGVGILSTVPGGGYASFSGTSMASPHVAGIAALVLTQNPSFTYSQIIDQVLKSTDKVTSLTGKTVTGGRVNAATALNVTTTPTTPVEETGLQIVSAKPTYATNGGVSGVRVTFHKPINASTFTTADITGFTGPSGALAVSSVAAVSGSNNTQFDVRFSTRTAVGNYTMKIGPNIADAAGALLDQDNDKIAGETTQDVYTSQFTINPTYTYTSNPNAAIRDGFAVPIEVKVDADLNITDLDVKINVSHSYDADLVMYLTGPDGTSVDLAVFRGGSGDNFQGTVFNDEASVSIAAGAAPFRGSYRPEQGLSAFDGKNARGTWTLWVEDWYLGYSGKVNSVSLSFVSVSTANAQAKVRTLDAAPSDSLPGRLQAKVAKLEEAVQKAVSQQKAERAVDAVFGAVQKSQQQWKSFQDTVQQSKANLKQQASHSWGSAVDQFMDLFARR